MFSIFLISEGIPYPEMNREDLNQGWVTNDSLYYPEEILEKLQQDLKSNRYQTEIKTYRSQKILYKRGAQAKFNLEIQFLNSSKGTIPRYGSFTKMSVSSEPPCKAMTMWVADLRPCAVPMPKMVSGKQSCI